MSFNQMTLNKFTNGASAPSAFAAALNSVAKATELEVTNKGLTWNGDVNFTDLGDGFEEALIALDFKTGILTEEERKDKSLSESSRDDLDILWSRLETQIRSLLDSTRSECWNLVFRYLFFSRSIRTVGKKQRLHSYYLFGKLFAIFPRTCIALLPLMIEFGYWPDLDSLLTECNCDPPLETAILRMQKDALDRACERFFGCQISLVTAAQAKELNTRLCGMSQAERDELKGSFKMDLFAKWISREGKVDLHKLRSKLITLCWPSLGLGTQQVKKDRVLFLARSKYGQMTMRNIISAFTQLLDVVEVKMTSCRFSEIDHSRTPAKAMGRYMKAMANEKLKTPPEEWEEDDGNRSELQDRIDCRHNLKALLGSKDGKKIHGAVQDLKTLAATIWSYVDMNMISLSSTVRAGLVAQWDDLFSKLKTLVDEFAEQKKASFEERRLAGTLQPGETFIDPRCVLAIVDRSGSMSSIQDISIAMGIVGSLLSTMTGTMITFSESPVVFNLDLSGGSDIFDHFIRVRDSTNALNTNVDKTLKLVLDLMKRSGTTCPDYCLLYLSDMQFDSESFIKFDGPRASFIERARSGFTSNGFNVPRIAFWNLQSSTPGFPALGGTKGVQMISGYSQTLMQQVFTGDYKYQVQEDGSVVVNVTPWSTLLTSLLDPCFDPVTRIVSSVGEGCLKHVLFSESDTPSVVGAVVEEQLPPPPPRLTRQSSVCGGGGGASYSL